MGTDNLHSLTIGGKRYAFRWAPCGPAIDGRCDSPASTAKEIRLRPGLKKHPRQLLETLLHECLHAADWSKSEDWTEDVSADLARILWRFGYRRDA